MMRKSLMALASGALFALGLVLSGMTQPAKVIGFLNVGGLFDPARFGAWDPSLAFVMGGALCVTLLAFALTPRPDRKPWLADSFQLPSQRDIDGRLVLGAALFGIGWGLAGYCPGPALASLLTGGLDALLFVAAMLAGMALARGAWPDLRRPTGRRSGAAGGWPPVTGFGTSPCGMEAGLAAARPEILSGQCRVNRLKSILTFT